MINLKLKRNETRFRNVEKDLLTMFHSCGTGKSNKNFRFAKVDSNFVNFLPYLKDGAVKLYLYYAAAANNDTGESWHSIDTISKKLSATERSIGNWNNQLENMGLIYRTSTGKRSKATFVLPLTGFAVKMSASQMEQALTELNLYTSNEHTRVFGKVQSSIKLYMKNEATDEINEVLCIHLKRVNSVDNTELNSVDTFLYDVSGMTNKELDKKLTAFEGEDKVAIIKGEKEITFGQKTIQPLRSFFITEPSKIDDATVYDILRQLTDDVDLSVLTEISI